MFFHKFLESFLHSLTNCVESSKSFTTNDSFFLAIARAFGRGYVNSKEIKEYRRKTGDLKITSERVRENFLLLNFLTHRCFHFCAFASTAPYLGKLVNTSIVTVGLEYCGMWVDYLFPKTDYLSVLDLTILPALNFVVEEVCYVLPLF